MSRFAAAPAPEHRLGNQVRYQQVHGHQDPLSSGGRRSISSSSTTTTTTTGITASSCPSPSSKLSPAPLFLAPIADVIRSQEREQIQQQEFREQFLAFLLDSVECCQAAQSAYDRTKLEFQVGGEEPQEGQAQRDWNSNSSSGSSAAQPAPTVTSAGWNFTNFNQKLSPLRNRLSAKISEFRENLRTLPAHREIYHENRAKLLICADLVQSSLTFGCGGRSLGDEYAELVPLTVGRSTVSSTDSQSLLPSPDSLPSRPGALSQRPNPVPFLSRQIVVLLETGLPQIIQFKNTTATAALDFVGAGVRRKTKRGIKWLVKTGGRKIAGRRRRLSVRATNQGRGKEGKGRKSTVKGRLLGGNRALKGPIKLSDIPNANMDAEFEPCKRKSFTRRILQRCITLYKRIASWVRRLLSTLFKKISHLLPSLSSLSFLLPPLIQTLILQPNNTDASTTSRGLSSLSPLVLLLSPSAFFPLILRLLCASATSASLTNNNSSISSAASEGIATAANQLNLGLFFFSGVYSSVAKRIFGIRTVTLLENPYGEGLQNSADSGDHDDMTHMRNDSNMDIMDHGNHGSQTSESVQHWHKSPGQQFRHWERCLGALFLARAGLSMWKEWSAWRQSKMKEFKENEKNERGELLLQKELLLNLQKEDRLGLNDCQSDGLRLLSKGIMRKGLRKDGILIHDIPQREELESRRKPQQLARGWTEEFEACWRNEDGAKDNGEGEVARSDRGQSEGSESSDAEVITTESVESESETDSLESKSNTSSDSDSDDTDEENLIREVIVKKVSRQRQSKDSKLCVYGRDPVTQSSDPMASSNSGKPTSNRMPNAKSPPSLLHDTSCLVCYTSPPKFATTTPCGHVFCWKCVADWISKTAADKKRNPANANANSNPNGGSGAAGSESSDPGGGTSNASSTTGVGSCPLCRADCCLQQLWMLQHV